VPEVLEVITGVVLELPEVRRAWDDEGELIRSWGHVGARILEYLMVSKVPSVQIWPAERAISLIPSLNVQCDRNRLRS
jgi:hypothetical protein